MILASTRHRDSGEARVGLVDDHDRGNVGAHGEPDGGNHHKVDRPNRGLWWAFAARLQHRGNRVCQFNIVTEGTQNDVLILVPR